MEKRILLIIVVAIITIILSFISLSKRTKSPPEQPQNPKMSNEKTIDEEKPPIVDHFACGDYCPGPREKYMVKIYQGVEDEEECRRLDGTPSSYTGWGTTNICIVNTTTTPPVKAQDNDSKTEEIKSYISCGCGCCEPDKLLETTIEERCLYKNKGESIQSKIEQDKQLTPDLCAMIGCSLPIKYIYCD